MHPDMHLHYYFHMVFRCTVFRCPPKSWVHKNLAFFSFPTETKLSQKWVATLKARAMDYKWKSSHRVYGAHFPGPLIRDKQYPRHIPFGGRTGQIVWQVGVYDLLNAEATGVME